jgi:hypothetical protein
MKLNRRNTWIPVAGISIAAILWIIVALLFVIDGEQFGTLAEWFGAIGAIAIGGLAAWFAAIAAMQASAANTWAQRAAEAEERSANLADRDLASKVRFTFGVHDMIDGLTVLRLGLADDSPPVAVKNVETTILYFAGSDHFEVWHQSFEDALRFLGGPIGKESHIDAPWLHEGNGPMDSSIRDQVLIRVHVTYTVIDHGNEHTYHELDLEIPPVPRIY